MSPVSEAVALKIQGNINYKQGNFSEALSFYDKGLAVDPMNIDILNNKGMALIKLGQIDEARKCQALIRQCKQQMAHASPAHSMNNSNGTGKPTSCHIRAKGPGEVYLVTGEEAETCGDDDQTTPAELFIRDIEQNIEQIQDGLEKVRVSRLKEAEDCKIQIKEMEENILVTQEGLEMVKLGRVEEEKKIKLIEDNLELTRKGLELIKLGRKQESKYYQLQLIDIRQNIELTRQNIKQVKQSAGYVNPAVSTPVLSRSEMEERRQRHMDMATITATATAQANAGTFAPEHAAAGPDQVATIEEIIRHPAEEEEEDEPRSMVGLAAVGVLFVVAVVVAFMVLF